MVLAPSISWRFGELVLFLKWGTSSLAWLEPAAWGRGGKNIQEASPSHCPLAINEDNEAGAIKIPPSNMSWGRFAGTSVSKSYCITLCDDRDPFHGAKST